MLCIYIWSPNFLSSVQKLIFETDCYFGNYHDLCAFLGNFCGHITRILENVIGKLNDAELLDKSSITATELPNDLNSAIEISKKK